MDVENEVIDELGLYIDFSSVRGDDGPIWILPDPNHENNSDMWMGGNVDEDALVRMDFSDYAYDVETEVLTAPKSEWKELYRKYIKSLIEE